MGFTVWQAGILSCVAGFSCRQPGMGQEGVHGVLPIPAELLTTEGSGERELIVLSCVSTDEPTKLQTPMLVPSLTEDSGLTQWI